MLLSDEPSSDWKWNWDEHNLEPTSIITTSSQLEFQEFSHHGSRHDCSQI